MPAIKNKIGNTQAPVQIPQPVVPNPVNSPITEVQNLQNDIITTKIPKSAHIALITSLLNVFCLGSLALFMTNIYGAIGLHGGTLNANETPALLLIGIGSLIFPILMILNIILGIRTLLNYKKNHIKKVLFIGLFTITVGALPIIGFIVFFAGSIINAIIHPQSTQFY